MFVCGASSEMVSVDQVEQAMRYCVALGIAIDKPPWRV